MDAYWLGEPAIGAVFLGEKWIQPFGSQSFGQSADHCVMQQNTVSLCHQVCPGNSLNVCVNQSEGAPVTSFHPFSSLCDFTLASDVNVLIGGVQARAFQLLFRVEVEGGRGVIEACCWISHHSTHPARP